MDQFYSKDTVLKAITTLKELFCKDEDKIMWDEVTSRMLKLSSTNTAASSEQVSPISDLSPMSDLTPKSDKSNENSFQSVDMKRSTSSCDVILELTQLNRNINRKLSVFITEKECEGKIWNVDVSSNNIYYLNCDIKDPNYGYEIGTRENNKPNLKPDWKYLLKKKK